MSIHRIHHNDDYLIFEIATREVLNKLGREHPFHIDRSPIAYAKWWREPLHIGFAPIEKTTKPIIPDIAVRSGRLFLSEKAYGALRDIMIQDGEFLPITYEGGKGYIFNPLTIAEALGALDEKGTFYDPHGNLQHINFIESAIRPHTVIFRASIDNYSGVFCTDTLKQAIEQAQLKGVSFQPDLASFAGEPSHHKH